MIYSSVQKGIERTQFNIFSFKTFFSYIPVITVVPMEKYTAFISRSDSRSSLKEAISSKRWNKWDSNLQGVFTNLLRSQPNYELGNVTTVLDTCLTLECMRGLEAHLDEKALHLFCREDAVTFGAYGTTWLSCRWNEMS